MALLLIPLFLALMYVLVVLPQQRRVRAHQAVVSSLVPGQQVMTTSGVYGTLLEVEDEFVQLEIAAGVVIKIARASVGLVVPEADEAGGRPDGTTRAPATDTDIDDIRAGTGSGVEHRAAPAAPRSDSPTLGAES